jgi:hypothetical protein
LGAVLWFLVLLYRHAFQKLPGWPDNMNGAVALAAMLGCTGIVVHSFVDFNLQVPANAAWFYVLATLAASSYPLESRQRIRRVRSHNHDALDPEVSTHPPASDTQ